MKTLTKAPALPASRWMPLARVGLAITLATGLAYVQAAPNDPAPASAGGTPQADRQTTPAKVPDAGGRPKHRKEVTKAPVKRPFYPSNPLPPVPQRP